MSKSTDTTAPFAIVPQVAPTTTPKKACTKQQALESASKPVSYTAVGLAEFATLYEEMNPFARERILSMARAFKERFPAPKCGGLTLVHSADHASLTSAR
jgi:hypothetical protein